MREKYVKGYFALSHLLVSYFLLFNVLFWSSIKKFWGRRFWSLKSWVLSLGSQAPGPGTQALGPGFWVLSLGPGFWVLCPGFWVLCLRSWVLGPYFRLCPIHSGSIENALEKFEKIYRLTPATLNKLTTWNFIQTNSIKFVSYRL